MTKADLLKECAPFYHGYINTAPDGEMVTILKNQQITTQKVLADITETQSDYRYAPGKWSVKEMINHVIDSERVFAYRAMCIARNDQTSLPGMDQDAYAQYSSASNRKMKDLADELFFLRAANIHMFQNMDEATLCRQGTASGVDFTVRALVHIIVGHEAHHIQVLKKHYLG